MTSFLSNPFEGDINPGTVSEQNSTLSSRLLIEKRGELLSIAQENVSEIMSAFRHDSNIFECGIRVNTITTDDGSKLKLLEDFQECTLQLVKQKAVVTWKYHNATPGGTLPTYMTQKDINPVDISKPEDLRIFIVVFALK